MRRHIATGGMASVWCAQDLVLGRNVAVKVLAERFADDQLAMRRFQREARAAARVCGHPHVVTVYDVGELASDPHDGTAGRAFIVMEFLAGGTVADAIRHDSVRRHEAMRWLREAASALDHAHYRGIVHRDIKPANFLLDRNRVLHVADFGIARLTSEDTITTSEQLFGTAAYLSPEQALGREATSASDRYALAVAAFELLVGERPFSAPHFSSQARQHIEEPPPAASERNRLLPPAVDEVFFAGLAKAAEDRPQTAGELVAALSDALSETGPVRPGRPGRPADARRPVAPQGAGPVASTAAARRAGARGQSTRSFERLSAEAPAPHRRRLFAFGAIALSVLVIAGIALAATRGHARSHPQTAAQVARRPVRVTAGDHHGAVRPVHVEHTTRTATTPTTATTTTVAAAPDAQELQAAGHAEMLDGNYSSAIPTLRQAVSASDPGSDTYAYALYDLGHVLVLSGDASQAIPILQKRLQIPNQTDTVQALLDQAYQDAAQGQAPSDGTINSPQTATSSTTTSTTTTSTTPTSGGAAAGSTVPAPTTPAPGTGTGTTPAAPTSPVQGPSGGAGLPGPQAVHGDNRAARARGHHRGGLLHWIEAAA